jgi:hypothetical protein
MLPILRQFCNHVVAFFKLRLDARDEHACSFESPPFRNVSSPALKLRPHFSPLAFGMSQNNTIAQIDRD